jgi:hypothetical protein
MGFPTMLERPTTSARLPLGSHPASRSSRMIPAGVHGRGPGRPIESAPTFQGWKPSASFRGSIASRTARSSSPFGSGSCTRIPCTARSALSLATSAMSSACEVEAGRCRPIEPHLLAVLALAPDVDGGGRILAHAHDREPRYDPAPGELLHRHRHLGAHLRRDPLPVDDLRHRAAQYSGAAAAGHGWVAR